MAKFEVVVTRETVEELKFIVDAPSLKAFERLTDGEVYEAADEAMGGLKAWKIVENAIDVLLKPVQTHKLPRLVFNTNATETEKKLIKYQPSTVDPRQMALPGTEK